MNILDRFLVWLGYFYIWAIGRTTRICVESSFEYQTLKKNKLPVIYAFWHGRQVFLVWVHRCEGVCILISRSKDGGYISGITGKFGYLSVRGSSTRGGYEALSDMVEKAKNGISTAFTPDGPKGPVRTVRPGVIITAQKSGLPVIPVGCALKRKFAIKNWDEFHIPCLFNKAVVCYGKPVYVHNEDSIDEKTAELKNAIDEVTSRADGLVLGM